MIAIARSDTNIVESHESLIARSRYLMLAHSAEDGERGDN